MAIIIPIKDNPNHSLSIEIDSKIYKLKFKFNSKATFWSMDIYSEDDILILSGIKLVANYPLISIYKNENLPTGDFICRISDRSKEITRNSFSSGEAEFVYLTYDEIATI